MMAGDMFASLVGALVSDVAAKEDAVLASVFGAAVSQVIQAIRRKRFENFRDIIIEEIRFGRKDIIDAAQIDDIISCLLRIGRAAEEGAARLNIRLMAAAMNGMYSKSRLIADDFLYFSNMLSTLKREEVIVLGVFHRHAQWADQLSGRYKLGFEVWGKVSEELVPKYMDTEEELRAYCGSLLRTGLLELVAGFGGPFHTTTPILDRLNSLVCLESALSRENAKTESEL